MSWKKILSDYFTFSRKDRIGILALVILILLMVLIPFFYRAPETPSLLKADSTLLIAAKPEQEVKVYKKTSFKEYFTHQSHSINHQSQENQYNPDATPFLFDPNELDEDGWKNLGLPARTIRTIINYRSKGGRFYKKEDLQKIWGLPEGFYQHVEAYIQITAAKTPANDAYTGKRERTINTIDINNADTTAFIALPGIGSKLAVRIVNFRDKLGGFHSIEQIGETYGLSDSAFGKIRAYLQCSLKGLRKINVNTATKDELKIHPYIRWSLANAIVEYRNQHGNFISLEDLKKISIIDEATFQKIQPYLSL